MGASPIRYKRLIEVLPKHKHAQDALIEAGFSKETARTKSKRVLHATLRHQATVDKVCITQSRGEKSNSIYSLPFSTSSFSISIK